MKRVFPIIGLLILLISFVLLIGNVSKIAFKKFTEGKIDQVSPNATNIRNGYLIHPTVEFIDDQGQKISFQGDMQVGGIYDNFNYLINQKVSVYYDPNMPDNASIFDFNGMFLSYMVLGSFGILLIVFKYLNV